MSVRPCETCGRTDWLGGLRCTLPLGHPGLHHQAGTGFRWRTGDDPGPASGSRPVPEDRPGVRGQSLVDAACGVCGFTDCKGHPEPRPVPALDPEGAIERMARAIYETQENTIPWDSETLGEWRKDYERDKARAALAAYLSAGEEKR